MDVLNATLIPIEGRVYRLIPTRSSVKDPEEQEKLRPLIHTEYEDDEAYDPNLPIMHKDDRFYITVFVPGQLMGYIIGQQHKTLRILEQYGAKINVEGKKNGTLTISGKSKDVVSVTYHRVMERVTTARLKRDSTHFISLPFNSSKIQESFLAFKKEVLEKHRRVRGIDESIFQNPNKLHLTVTPLVLLDERDNQNAIDILTKCIDNTLKDFNEKEFIVKVKGLEYLNDDFSEVHVLYAKVQELDDDNRLQILCDNIMKEFCAANLSKDKYDKVKIHITLMNTIFHDKLENEENRDEVGRKPFDAGPILAEFKDYDFGQITISEIHISIRYTEASDGYYKAVKKLKLSL